MDPALLEELARAHVEAAVEELVAEYLAEQKTNTQEEARSKVATDVCS